MPEPRKRANVDEWSPPVGRRRWREVDGRRMVDALRRSGETPQAFAHRYGVEETRVRRWIRRLAETPRTRSQWGRSSAKSVRFAPVQVTTGRLEQPAAGVSGILDVVAGKAVVRVGRDFDEDLLRRVVAALGGGPC